MPLGLRPGRGGRRCRGSCRCPAARRPSPRSRTNHSWPASAATSCTTPCRSVAALPPPGRQPGVEHLGDPVGGELGLDRLGRRPAAICASQRCTAVSWAIRRCQNPAFLACGAQFHAGASGSSGVQRGEVVSVALCDHASRPRRRPAGVGRGRARGSGRSVPPRATRARAPTRSSCRGDATRSVTVQLRAARHRRVRRRLGRRPPRRRRPSARSPPSQKSLVPCSLFIGCSFDDRPDRRHVPEPLQPRVNGVPDVSAEPPTAADPLVHDRWRLHHAAVGRARRAGSTVATDRMKSCKWYAELRRRRTPSWSWPAAATS